MKTIKSLQVIFVAVILMMTSCADSKKAYIKPWPDNPHYLAWGDTPVFLLGATGYHAWTPISRPGTIDFHEQLNRLSRVIEKIGSPHVVGFARCLPYDPYNHMHDGAVVRVLQPWVRMADGRYDLRRFEPEWEKRLKEYLDLALDLRIIVVLEVWDDWSVTRGKGTGSKYNPVAAWDRHSFNPDNNINYDNKVLPDTTSRCDAPFYSTIPANLNIPEVLDLQTQYVDHLLSIVSDYPNIIINISNESRADLEWSRFWAEYIRQRVPPSMMIGDMPSRGQCDERYNPMTLSTDSHYDFVDISQDVAQQILEYRLAMADAGTRRPIIVSKIYARGPGSGTVAFWGRFVGGAASSRFHRPALDQPPSIIDFQHETVAHLGRFIARLPFWLLHPRNDVVNLLPEGTEVNVLTDLENHYVIQLIGGSQGEKLELQLSPGKWTVSWIDPASGTEFANNDAIVNSNTLDLDIQGEFDHRIIYITKIHIGE